MKTDLLKNKLIKTLVVSLAVATIASLFMTLGFLNTWESKISDAFYTPSNPLDDIIIVAIDDKSLQELGRWPWPRNRFAKVIEYLNQSSVVGIDVSFFEPADGDSELADSLKKSKVVLAMEYTSFSIRNGELYGEELLKPTITIGTPDVDFKIGFVNLYTDSDGVTRSFIPTISGVENNDHFSVVVAGEFLGVSPKIGNSKMLINFFARPGGYKYISFSDVYRNQINQSYFNGKIVLIGVTAADLHDEVIVPISNQAMPGVEVNANLIQSIITHDFIYYQDAFSATVFIFLFALLTGLLLYRLRIYIATVILMIFAVIYIFFSIYIFDSFGIIMNIPYPIFTISAVYIGLVSIYYRSEEKSRKWITSLFGKYVSPVVIDNLIKNPEKIRLGGERRNITILFSDIRNFTSISEKLEPEDLVSILNDYLTNMSMIIIENQGLVDKYMGDAIMAFWGAPLEQTNHAEMACLSSLEMIDKLRELKQKWKKKGLIYFDIGIGLNSGNAIVGNMGSKIRFDYTAIGDNVNIASRMEGLNKIYGTNIIITENTYKLIKDQFETRKLDAVKVKGKKKTIFIYELLSKKGLLDKKQLDFISFYENGLELYFKRKWISAIKSFKEALKLVDDDVCRIFINRCERFSKNPPSKNWDGVWEIKTK